jgi:hypothetical protein
MMVELVRLKAKWHIDHPMAVCIDCAEINTRFAAKRLEVFLDPFDTWEWPVTINNLEMDPRYICMNCWRNLAFGCKQVELREADRARKRRLKK